MGETKKKGNPGHNPGNPGNPGHITPILCEAYRDTIMAEIKGLKNTIILGLSISTTIITMAVYLLSLGGG